MIVNLPVTSKEHAPGLHQGACLKSLVLWFLTLDFPDSWFQGIQDAFRLLSGVGKKLFSLLILRLQGKGFQAGLGTFQTRQSLLYLARNGQRRGTSLISLGYG